MVGSVMSALYGDNTYLFTNAMLDLVTSTVLASTYGIGMVLAAPVLFLFQGSIYLVTSLAGDVISDSLMCEISIVGGVLIASSGLSILGIKDCRTLNMLPALLVPVLFYIVKSFYEPAFRRDHLTHRRRLLDPHGTEFRIRQQESRLCRECIFV